jgi:hypothetical protein
MAKPSLSCAPFSDNDVLILAHLFEISVDYFRSHQSPQAMDFIREIRTIACLGLTAVLSDDGYLYPYQTYFNEFIQGNKGDFREDTGAASLWGKRMAEMISISLGSFRRLNYPNYYRDFVEAIERNLKNVRIDVAGKTAEGQRIFDALPFKQRNRY